MRNAADGQDDSSVGKSKLYRVLVGTYSTPERPGIFVCDWDDDQGQLDVVYQRAGVENPSFLVKHPEKPWLYAVSEVSFFQGSSGAGVVAFAIDDDWQLEPLNGRSTGGGGACHVSLDRTGRFVCVANYGGGSLAVFPIEEDGSLGERSAFVQHTGRGKDPGRQDGPHVHSVTPDPTQGTNRLYVADLGLDRISTYRLDPGTGQLASASQPWVGVTPGAGPRHFVIREDGRYAYVINELNSTITVFRREASSGSLKVQQSVSTLPEDWQGHNQCSDIHLHPNGRFLYGANRGHNSIAVYAVDEQDGGLELIQTMATEGRWPRNFALDPSGRWLLAANEESDTITSFRIDVETGLLEHVGRALSVPKPVCVLFVERGEQDDADGKNF